MKASRLDTSTISRERLNCRSIMELLPSLDVNLSSTLQASSLEPETDVQLRLVSRYGRERLPVPGREACVCMTSSEWSC